jgi:hypothetical protein
MYNLLTPTPIRVEIPNLVLLTLGVFLSLTSTKEVAIFKLNVSLFQHNQIPLEVFDPLKCWAYMKNNFLTLDYLHIKLWDCWLAY